MSPKDDDLDRTIIYPQTLSVEISPVCEYKSPSGARCNLPATHITAYSSEELHMCDTPLIGSFCSDHSRELIRRTRPEYIVSCHNCGCIFGVN